MNRKKLGTHAKTIKVKGNLSIDLRVFGSRPWISGSVVRNLVQETGAGLCRSSRPLLQSLARKLSVPISLHVNEEATAHPRCKALTDHPSVQSRHLLHPSWGRQT